MPFRLADLNVWLACDSVMWLNVRVQTVGCLWTRSCGAPTSGWQVVESHLPSKRA